MELDLEQFQENINQIYFRMNSLIEQDPEQMKIHTEAHGLLIEIGAILERYVC